MKRFDLLNAHSPTKKLYITYLLVCIFATACYRLTNNDDGDLADTIAAAEAFERAVHDGRCGIIPDSDDVLPPRLRADLEENRVTFDKTVADQCIRWLDNHACVGFGGLQRRLPGRCREVYEGDILAGKQCEGTFECLGDATCKPITEGYSECQLREPAGSFCYLSETCSVASDRIPACIAVDSDTRICVSQRVSEKKASRGEPCGNHKINGDNFLIICEKEYLCSSEVEGVCI
jgi:hypothetical protein